AQLKDFELKGRLGGGSYGIVLLVKHTKTKILHALKIQLPDKAIYFYYDSYEENILSAVNFPFVVNLNYVIHEHKIFGLALEYVDGGDLLKHLFRVGKFSNIQSKFIASQLVLALEHLHHLKIVHRDIKPENILMDMKGYTKLSDFGFAKLVNGRTYTWCGTPNYIAPEIIKMKGYNNSVDWWSFGILLYELISGNPPFDDDDHSRIYSKVLAGQVRFFHLKIFCKYRLLIVIINYHY
ncbi:hypothetical protein HELRODRAFT_67852, partial [Helobdella robusta]|uniref:Protein kinase domain-containing protein n=1 Tax=Helobdella robusta TaxID=6412 RepID=T1FZ62_HELRO